MTRRRVVVTGLGLVSPVGNTVDEGWANLVAGRSGIDLITRFDASAMACRFAGEVKGFDVEQYMPAKEARHMDTFIHFGLAASMQAVQDAGLATGDALSEEQAERIGCIVGSGIGGLPMIEATHEEYRTRGPRRISPFFVPASIINTVNQRLQTPQSASGINCTPGTSARACSSMMPPRAQFTSRAVGFMVASRAALTRFSVSGVRGRCRLT